MKILDWMKKLLPKQLRKPVEDKDFEHRHPIEDKDFEHRHPIQGFYFEKESK